MIVAITGTLGAGKSTAAKIFAKAGFKLIDADRIGHELYHAKKIKARVVKAFGDKILTKNEIDRNKLKEIVFHNPKKLILLNNIMHPAIVSELNKRSKSAKGKNTVIDAALLIEVGFKNFDKLLVLTINKKMQLKRLMKKGKYTKLEISNIIISQLPQEKKMGFADYIIDNSGTKKQLAQNVKKLLKTLS